jgi:small subunit ribosomal protein S20
MPNTPSAKAELIRSLTRRERNRGRRSLMRTWIKKTLDSIEAGDKTAATESLVRATQFIDKNVKWNQMHPNTAARKKSSLTLKVNAL